MNLFRYFPLATLLPQKLKFLWLALLNLPLPRRLFNRLGRRPSYLSFLTLTPKSLDGLSVTLDPTDASHVIIFDEVFLDHIYDFSQVPFTPTQIIDCGGHIGLFTLTVSHHFPGVPITVFEPNPDNIAYLKAQIDRNELAVNLVESAVSTSDGMIQFAAGSSCSGKILQNATSVENTISVRTLDLKKTLTSLNAQKLLLKMDIEGAEMDVIPDICPLLPPNTAFFFETHGGDTTWDTIKNLLTDNGFTVIRTSERGPYSDGFGVRTASMSL